MAYIAKLDSEVQLLQMRHALCSHCLVGVISIDGDKRIDFVNSTAHKLIGLADGEVLGAPLTTLLTRIRERAQVGPVSDELLDDLAANGFCMGAIRMAGKSAGDGTIELTSMRSSVDPARSQIYVRDVTAEVEVDRMKSEFLAHAAHELRTPMASIFGFSELLISQEFDEATRKELLATIHKQTAWLVKIINELLDLARIEARRGKDFKFEAVRLAPLAASAIEALNADVTRWPIEIAISADLPPVRADEAKLCQALLNVIGNAVKYSPAGGAIEIRGLISPSGRQAGFSVTDHGIGLTAAQAARVGERFYRADDSGKIPGTGLGMAIVKEIVELHGGSFEIESALGHGTTVILWLPTVVAQQL